MDGRPHGLVGENGCSLKYASDIHTSGTRTLGNGSIESIKASL